MNPQLRNPNSASRSTRSAGSQKPNPEHQWFEFDRRTVLSQIDLMHRTLDANAKELGMVAVEGVFEKSIADELSRTSRSLLMLVRQLSALRARVATAGGYPKDSKEARTS